MKNFLLGITIEGFSETSAQSARAESPRGPSADQPAPLATSLFRSAAALAAVVILGLMTVSSLAHAATTPKPQIYGCAHTAAPTGVETYVLTFSPRSTLELGMVAVAKRSVANVLENVGSMSCRLSSTPPYMPYVEEICSSANLGVVVELMKPGKTSRLRTAMVYNKAGYSSQNFTKRPVDILSCWYQ